MEVIRTLQSPSESHPSPSAVVIGNFDGFHLGHQALIDEMHALATAGDLVPSMMCFEPLPATYFNPEQPIRRLLSVRDKALLAQTFGIKRLMMLRFNQSFAQLSPESFVREAIVQRAQAKHVIVGNDFRFGHQASGDLATMTELGQQYGFEVHGVGVVEHAGERISSTKLRALLAQGDLIGAERLLGRPYAISGRVLRGQQLGQTLGYATVNIRPPIPPALHGIFAVRVSSDRAGGPQQHPGVASLGYRPTVDGRDWLLEAHLFDYDGTLYGHHLCVEFVAFIRSEEKFGSLDEMVERMHEDARQAKQVLASNARH